MELSIENKKAQIIKGTNIFLIISFILIFLLPSASAVNNDNAMIVSMAETILSGPMNTVTNTISAGAGGGDVFGNLWAACTGAMPSWLEGAFNFIKGLGALLAIAITMSHIFENIQKEQNPVEAVWKGLVELFATFLILMNIPTILDKAGEFMTDVINHITTGGTIDSGASADELLLAMTGATSGNIWWYFKAWVALAVPWMLTQLIIVAAKFVVIQICLEIIIRKTFAPLAIADIYQEGLRSPGMRYLKRYFGAYFKMAVCAVICLAISNLSAGMGGGLSHGLSLSSAADSTEYCFSIIALNFSAVAVMLKAGEFTNDIVGA